MQTAGNTEQKFLQVPHREFKPRAIHDPTRRVEVGVNDRRVKSCITPNLGKDLPQFPKMIRVRANRILRTRITLGDVDNYLPKILMRQNLIQILYNAEQKLL